MDEAAIEDEAHEGSFTELNGVLDRLIENIEEKGSVMVALSGGVDSALVAIASKRALGSEASAAVLVNETIPDRDLIDARRIASWTGIDLTEIDIDILAEEDFLSNPPDRCAVCRKKGMKKLIESAEIEGFKVVLDGANIDDLDDYRPGMKAADDIGVKHPLVECGIGKDTVRRILKMLDFPFYKKASSPCLATRIPYGEGITGEKLEEVDRIEEGVRALDFEQVRARLYETREGQMIAVLEVDDPRRALDVWESISGLAGDTKMVLEPVGYVKGMLNRTLRGP